MSTLFADVFQLPNLLSEYSKLQVPLWGPAHLHIQEGEFVFCYDLIPIFLFGGQGVCSVCPDFRGEFQVLVKEVIENLGIDSETLKSVSRPTVYEDNNGAIVVTKIPRTATASNHIDVKYHCFR